MSVLLLNLEQKVSSLSDSPKELLKLEANW